ncbi:MAG: carboxypeptidase-like regulatory domain-containing protein [Bacteroidota bacterium]|nr:carboxypeptidase-like regulatory domain-containing protein [Bacteroidota bacterium]MDP4211862.1 carboxypeptidase-like regulatory domain-containing protein [Bacteroidota bacterium]MDP4250930.1 carboxypeptidase-like regulatory domain-containing protein [Bacteroidota bacterium]
MLFFSQWARTQVLIRGTIYDRSEKFVLQGVSVLGTSGAGTVTDSSGRYQIRLLASDSLYFSYLGKPTQKFPVKEIGYPEEFDMSLQVTVDSLQPVYVRSRNYIQDSLETRQEYKKIFDYDGPDMFGSPSSGVGFGFNFDLLFQGRQNRRTEAFQKRLLYDERENYIDHYFSRSLVKRITGLEPPMLDTFMQQYRPSYEFIQGCYNDYEYYGYILRSSKYFMEEWKQDHPDEAAPDKQNKE